VRSPLLAGLGMVSLALGGAACGAGGPAASTTGTAHSSSSTGSTTTGPGGAGGTGGIGGAGVGGGTGGGGGGPFVTAPHAALPQVPDNGGRRLAHVQLVTATFPGYPYEAEVQAFGDWIVGSSWLQTVGADYGVGTGTHVKKVVLAEAAPVQITDDEIQAWIAQRIQDGTLPAPPALDNDYLYALYYPEGSTIDLGGGVLSCVGFGGYHNSIDTPSLRVSYAVLPACTQVPDELANIEISSSHELIEAATDAAPLTGTAGFQINDPGNPWTYVGGEVGDLCVGLSVVDSGFTVTRSWSNTAANLGVDPCVPVSGPYFNMSPSPSDPLTVPAGTPAKFTLTGWSSAPVPDWYIVAQQIFGDFTPQVSFDSTSLNNGQTTTATIDVPAGTPSGSYAAIELVSAQSQDTYTSVAVVVIVQ